MERDSVNCTKGRGLWKKSYFPNSTNKPCSRRTAGCRAAIFALASVRESRFGWETAKSYSRTLFSPSVDWAPTSQVGEVAKSSPRRPGWICSFGWELDGTRANVGNTTSAQRRFTTPPSFPPMLGCHTLTCITTPPPSSALYTSKLFDHCCFNIFCFCFLSFLPEWNIICD